MSTSFPVLMSALPTLIRSDTTSRIGPELGLDGRLSSCQVSEEEECEGSGATVRVDWAELSSEEEVELQLELDSDSEFSGSSGGTADVVAGERSTGWTRKLDEDLSALQPPKGASKPLQRNEILRGLVPSSRTKLRIPIGSLLKAGVGRPPAVLLQTGMTYRGKEIIFSRLA